MTQSSMLSGPFLYDLLAGILNRALTGDEYGRARLAELDGSVVRLRGENPVWVLYALIHEDGLELLQEYEGTVDVRIRGPLGGMLHWLLIADDDQPEDSLRITGATETLAGLRALARDFSLWSLVRRWFEDHVQLGELLDRLRREDPAWLARLAGLPSQTDALTTQLARQQLLQEDMLEEMQALRRDVRRTRYLDGLLLVTGLVLIAVLLMGTA